jgi:hypothetical protein
VTQDWRALHNAQLHDLYPSRNIIWGDQMKEGDGEGGGTCREEQKHIQGYGNKNKRKVPLGRTRW